MMASSSFATSKKLSTPIAKRFRLLAVTMLIAVTAAASLDAEARRMGGGRSVGRQSQTIQKPSTPPAQQSSQQSAQQAQQAQRVQPAQAAPAASARSRWLGPIAGLAAGLGIAALLSHFGLGGAFAGAMANMIVIALIAMAAIWLIRKLVSRRQRAHAPAWGAAASAAPASASMSNRGFSMEDRSAPASPYSSPLADVSSPAMPPAAVAAPGGFDSEAFLRHAKVSFVRLQAAWDEHNLADIREFTTPEMFAEVKIDLDARGAERNQTDVVQLDAELLEVNDQRSEYTASVRFSGLIRETVGAAAQPFVEIWNMSKSADGRQGWLLAGIQQVSMH